MQSTCVAPGGRPPSRDSASLRYHWATHSSFSSVPGFPCPTYPLCLYSLSGHLQTRTSAYSLGAQGPPRTRTSQHLRLPLACLPWPFGPCSREQTSIVRLMVVLTLPHCHLNDPRLFRAAPCTARYRPRHIPGLYIDHKKSYPPVTAF